MVAATPMRRVRHEQVHDDLDVHYFADYALFTGVVRQYVARTLEQSFRTDPNDLHRRLCIIGLYKEECAAYEDLGAFLESIIRWNKREVKVPFENILKYKDDRVVLSRLFKKHEINNHNDLSKSLQIDPPDDWNDHFPNVDCSAGLFGICSYIVGDCLNSQKEYGIDAYNKIKHGLAIFPSGRRYGPALPDGPAVIINNRDKNDPNPYILLALQMSNNSIEQRVKTIEFVQAAIRTLASLYVIKRYPGHFSKSLSMQADSQVFSHHTMSDVRNFFWQIAAKYGKMTS